MSGLRTIPLALAAGALAGCATAAWDDPAANPVAAAPLACVDRTQCDLYWKRAQAWVANNSVYRISTATDTIIETYGPTTSRPELAYKVTRVPDGRDGARILIVTTCAPYVPCSPTRTDATVAFKQFVRSGP